MFIYLYHQDPLRNFIYILHVGRYRSRVLLSIILILGYDLEVKVTDLEISFKRKKKKLHLSLYSYIMKTLLLVSLILSMMVYIGLKFFSAPSPSWGMAFKSRSQTFHTNVIFAYIIKTDFTGIW